MILFCNDQPPWGYFGLVLTDRGIPMCVLKEKHNGPHEAPLWAEKFGLVGRIQWIDAFPDFPRPLHEQEEEKSE